MILKTLFIISITTAKVVFPDMPILPEALPGSAPAEVATSAKSVTMTLTSPKYTTGIPSAHVDVPEGLGVESSVKMIVRNPKPAPEGTGSSPAAKKVVSKTYWGSGSQIEMGQPRVEEVEENAGESKLSFAHWPIGYTKEKVAGPKARAAGKYTVTTNYCGNGTATVDEDQTYLDPVEVVGLKGKMDTSKPLTVKWKKVPGAVGYVVNAFSGSAAGSVSWTSGSDPEIALNIDRTPVAKENLESYLTRKVLLAPDASACTIPADVFKGADNVMVVVTAVGKDTFQKGENMDAQVLVRSTSSILMTAINPAPEPVLVPGR